MIVEVPREKIDTILEEGVDTNDRNLYASMEK
jgi:hypothetical protein